MHDIMIQAGEYPGEVLFSPLAFKSKDLPNDLDSCRLEEHSLIEFAKLATEAKERFLITEHKLSRTDAEEEKKDSDGGDDFKSSLKRGYLRKKEKEDN